MFIKTAGSYPKVIEKIGGQRESRRSTCNLKKNYREIVWEERRNVLPSLTGLLYSWFISNHTVFATTAFTWFSTVPPWTDTNLHRIYAWKKIL